MRHPLTKRNALSTVLSDFEREVGRLFDPHQDLFNLESSDWLPPVDIREEDNQFVITADIPGVELKDIDVSVENNILAIKGKRETELKEGHNDFVRIERAKGTFSRHITLPDTANLEKIDAKYNQGVLQITIPKQKERMSRKISVKQ